MDQVWWYMNRWPLLICVEGFRDRCEYYLEQCKHALHTRTITLPVMVWIINLPIDGCKIWKSNVRPNGPYQISWTEVLFQDEFSLRRRTGSVMRVAGPLKQAQFMWCWEHAFADSHLTGIERRERLFKHRSIDEVGNKMHPHINGTKGQNNFMEEPYQYHTSGIHLHGPCFYLTFYDHPTTIFYGVSEADS